MRQSRVLRQLSEPVSDKETVIAYEVGYKGAFADGRGQVNASIYRYDYEGYQDQIDTYDSAQNRSVDTVTNAGDAVNQGFEIGKLASWRLPNRRRRQL